MAPRRPSKQPAQAPVQDPNPLEHGHVGNPEDDEEAALAALGDQEGGGGAAVSIESLQRDMLAMERRHSEELANIRRASPPPRAVEPPAPDPEPIEQLLFTEPKRAVAKLREQVRQEIEQSLTQKYTQDQNTQKFWTAFDTKYPDLKDDRDIVEVLLNKNLDTLANVPVEDAMEKLAELTRTRISRYTKAPPRKRPFAEGAASPTPPRQAAEDEAPPSLSDIVRRRRAARQNRATVA
jgi:hypothetical protein